MVIRIDVDSAPRYGIKQDKERTAAECVNAYLKEYFQLNNVHHITGKKAKLHFNVVAFIYNSCKLAVDPSNVQLNEQNGAA